MSSLTLQEQMQTKLQECGIPAKEIRCYGQQIMITAYSLKAAQQWANLLCRMCSKVRMGESYDYCKKNNNTCLLPSRVRVWRVWGTI